MAMNSEPTLQNTAPKQAAHLMRLAIGLWIALAVAVCVKSWVQQGGHSVYPVYAWGSRHWWADQPLHALYREMGLDIYRYSPTFAIVFTPFALLPDWLGASLWGILNVAVTFWAMHLMVRDLLPGSWPPKREALFLGLTAIGSMSGIWSGQSNSLLLALVIFAAVAIVHQRWWAAACLLCLPVFIKIWPIAAALLFMACWPKKLIWRFAIIFAALAAVPFLTRPYDIVLAQYKQWYLSLIDQDQGRWAGFRDAWTIWENLWPPVSQRAYQVLQVVSSLPVLLWCLYQRRRFKNFTLSKHRPLADRERALARADEANGHLLILVISIWASWQLLFGPGSEQLTYGLIAPSVAWAMLISYQEKKHRIWATLNWLVPALFGCGEIELPLIRLHPAFAMLLPLSVVSFVAWLVYRERGAINR
jgi:hypothetical protein